MLTFTIAISILCFNSFAIGGIQRAVSEWGQCGGSGYSGPTDCEPGCYCFKRDQYFSQCLRSCPADWECIGIPISSTTTTAGPPPVGKFPNCQFRFGMGFNGAKDYSAGDYITVWIGQQNGQGNDFHPYWHGSMLEEAKKYKKIPVYYGYIIAFMARQELGLQDCDVSSTNSLCTEGSNYIRNNRAKIIAQYKHYAQETAQRIGRNGEIVWIIEPDFWQYYGDTHQKGGPLSGTYMRAFFDDIVGAIKSELPYARISWDISAWLTEDAMRIWWGFFATSSHIDYINTSGGQSYANSTMIKPNELRYSFMSTLTGKRIMADTGYGIAGVGTGHNDNYDDVNNLLNRIRDGVMSVSQENFKSNWGPVLDSVRPKLPKLC